MVDAKGQPLFARLHKAMNGLRVGPLSWYLEFTKTFRGEFGFKETADPTVHFRNWSVGIPRPCDHQDHFGWTCVLWAEAWVLAVPG